MKRYVYKIFDKLNEDNFYIGTAFDVNKRWLQHKNNSNSKKLKYDIEEFGHQDFSISIIFEGTEKEAYEKEIQLIKDLSPYYNNIGDKGGKIGIDSKGENHFNSIFKEKDIIDICIRVNVNEENIPEVAKDYPQVQSMESFYHIVNGDSWQHVLNAPRKKARNNTDIILCEQDIIDICIRVNINKEAVLDVAKDYPMLKNKLEIYAIVNGDIWKHVLKAPRRKAQKQLSKEQVTEIRNLSLEGITVKEIQKDYFPNKHTETLKNVINGKSFSNAGGPIKGKDY